MNKVKSEMQYLLIESAKEWFSIKGATVFLILLFFSFYQMFGVIEYAAQYERGVVPVTLPYLFGDFLFLMIFGLVVVYFFSDVPFIKRGTTFTLIRLGRRRWGMLQVLRVFINSGILMMLEFVISIGVCIGHMELESDWGAVWNTLSIGQITSSGISFSRNIVILYTPVMATIRVLIMGMIVVTVLGLLQFALSLWLGSQCAMIVVGTLAVGPIIAASWVYKNLYYISIVSWIGILEHSGQYLSEGPRGSYMIEVLVGLTIILIMLILIKVQTIDLQENQEE